MKQPIDYQSKEPVADDRPEFGVLSALVTGCAALACLASIVALREGPRLVGAINLPIWSLVLLHQYRTYRQRRITKDDKG
jgi:hypothetical protein